MNKQELINKCKNEEDKLLVSKILDKIKLAKTKNQITNTEFLDMYQKKVTEEVLQAEKYENYILQKRMNEISIFKTDAPVPAS